jgi:hypothetical protein
MYWKKETVEATKLNTIRNYNDGSVVFRNIISRISSESFTKRAKIFDVNNTWVDTKPLMFPLTCITSSDS